MSDPQPKQDDRALVWFLVGGVVLGVLGGTVVGILTGSVGLTSAIGISFGIGLGMAGWYLWRDLRRR